MQLKYEDDSLLLVPQSGLETGDQTAIALFFASLCVGLKYSDKHREIGIDNG